MSPSHSPDVIAPSKVAVVTGAASGIGLGLSERFAAEGMHVVMADVEEPALSKAAAAISDTGGSVLPVVTDVSDRGAVDALRDSATAAFGAVHVVCNNAGVGGTSGTDNVNLKDWRWVVDINLMGVVHGVKTFVPLIKRQGEGGHIVNTASMAGFLPGTGFGPYTATKFAVLGISEALQVELEPAGIGVSVLCPGWVATKITDSRRNWPKEYGDPPPRIEGSVAAQIAELVKNGMQPADVAALVLNAVQNNQLYIFTHPHMRPPLEKRVDRFMAAYRKLGLAPQEQAR